jgi:HAD superfamily hydrolase (TIGR01549 family)
MIKLVIFDMDGVLVDSHDAWFMAAKSVMRTLGDDLTMEEFDARCWGRPFGSAWRKNGMPIENMKVAGEILHREYLKEADRVKLFDGVHELFSFLRSRGIKVALLTNTPKWVAEKVMQKLGLEFDAMPDLSKLKAKPSPEGILNILKTLKMEKNEAVMVGDTNTDEEAGLGAGLKTVMVGRDVKSVAELPAKFGLKHA